MFLLIFRQIFNSIRHFFSVIRHFIGTFRHFSGMIRHFIGILEIIEVNSGVNLTSINIDAQIHLAANKLWFPQTGSLYPADDSWNTAAPMLN